MATVKNDGLHRIYAIDEVAALVGLCVRQIRREIRAGRLESWKDRKVTFCPRIGRVFVRYHIRVSGEALSAWIVARKVRADAIERERRPGRRLTAL